MASKHRFVVVVILGATVVAGFFVLGRSVQLGAASATATPALVSARARSLDRLEAQLRRQLAALPEAPPLTRSPATSPGTRYLLVPDARAATHGEDDDGHDTERHDGALGRMDGDD